MGLVTFFKNAILSPGKSIGERHSASIPLTAIFLSIVIASLITFIHLRILYGEYVLISTALVFMILMILLFLLFFGLTYMMNKIVIRESMDIKQVFGDVSGLGVTIFALYILMIFLFSFIPYQIGLIVLLIFNLLMISVPVFITLNYAKGHDTRVNPYFAAGLYYLIVIIFVFTFFWPVVRVGIDGLFY